MQCLTALGATDIVDYHIEEEADGIMQLPGSPVDVILCFADIACVCVLPLIEDIFIPVWL